MCTTFADYNKSFEKREQFASQAVRQFDSHSPSLFSLFPALHLKFIAQRLCPKVSVSVYAKVFRWLLK